MTLAQVKNAERRMQQQWHDLAVAEREGQSVEALEHMYNLYIRYAEEWNALKATYARQDYRTKSVISTPHTKSA